MMIWLLIVLNFLICAWNSFASGFIWESAKSKTEKFIAGAALTIGFVGMLYTFVLIGVATNILGQEFLLGSNVILGLPLILAGIVITVHGWVQTIRHRSFWHGLISVWNTFAVIWDIRVWIQSIQAVGQLGGFKGMFSELKKDRDYKIKAIIFGIVAVAGTALISIGLFNMGRKKAK